MLNEAKERIHFFVVGPDKQLMLSGLERILNHASEGIIVVVAVVLAGGK